MRIAASLLGILGIGLTMSARADIPLDPAQVRPLSVGTRAPQFAGTAADGTVRTFTSEGYRQRTIVIFYRGGWCP